MTAEGVGKAIAARRCIVEVRWGKLAGTKAVIEQGSSLRVGRTRRADFVVPHDGKLSGVHFELSWDGERCRLRDLESLTGTRLGGEPVNEGQVPHGGWIDAGETDFMVYFEGHTPAPDELDEEEEAELNIDERRRRSRRREAAARAFDTLRRRMAQEKLYAVLDASRGPRILQLLREAVEPHRSLYEGEDGEVLESVAPYLVGPMQADSGLLERLVREGWGRQWGIFCTSSKPFQEVRRHWRRFLTVTVQETGQRLYFRFYDPACLRNLWGMFSERQKVQLTSRIGALIFEAGLEVFEPLSTSITQGVLFYGE